MITPETCVLYMVFELLDEVGPITFRVEKNNVFTFSNRNYKLPGESRFKLKNMELKNKYVLAFRIEKRKLIGILMSNNEKPDFQLGWNERYFNFEKIIPGEGNGLVYDLIIVNSIVKEKEDRKNVNFLKKLHKVPIVTFY